MSQAVKRRRGTNTEHNSFTGLEGEISVNTTNESVHVHDGSTAGGFELARADLNNYDGTRVAGTLNVTDLDVDGTTTVGGSVLSDTDSTDSLGSTAVRWLKGWFDTLAAGTLTIGSGSITDSSGAISFGNENLSTTGTLASGALDVTGTATVDAVLIEPSDAQVQFNSSAYKIKGGSNYGDIRFEAPRFRFYESNGVALQIDNNDISFYEDTGSTVKLFWDASAESLGIGTTSPDNKLHVNSGTTNTVATFESTDATARIVLKDNSGQAQLQCEGDNFVFGNTASGSERLRIDSSGNIIVAGSGTIQTATAGTSNFRAGVNAGNSIASGGDYNTVVGDQAGTAISTGDRNVLVGYNAGKEITTSGSNTLVGAHSGDALNTGNHNVALGYATLSADTKGDRNVAVGSLALQNQNFTSTTDSYNIAVGYGAGNAITTGTNNTLVGGLAGDVLTTGNSNVAVGLHTLGTDTKGDRNVAVGVLALQNQNFTSSTDSYNVGVGYNAGNDLTTGLNNTLVGGLAGDALTDADSNVAVGYAALSTDTLGSRSVAIGRNALAHQNLTSATNVYNTALGYQAGYEVTTGLNNTLVGGLTGDALTTGSENVALGRSALSGDTLGSHSVAVGFQALASQNLTSATDVHNVAVGYNAGVEVTTGLNNTLVGGLTGDALTTGNYNVIFGGLSDSTAVDSEKAQGFGYNVSCAAGYTTIGSGADDIRAAHGNVTWATVSDERYKKDIVDSTAGLSFINALQPRTWQYKTLGELPETFNAYEADSTEVFKNSDTNHGFIAQEVKAAIDADSSIKDGFRLWDDRDDGSQEVAEAALIPVLTKAIQELSAQVEALTARIETLEG
tara:strand:+ start:1243 stop:3783 length:2541 start_codon:yes stop_codon:yes gene_type:complete